jgi:hypothetical protein
MRSSRRCGGSERVYHLAGGTGSSPPLLKVGNEDPDVTPADDPSGAAPDTGDLVQLGEEAGVYGERYIHGRRFLFVPM